MQSACKCTEFNVLQQIAIIHPNLHRVMPLYPTLDTLFLNFSVSLQLNVSSTERVPICNATLLSQPPS